VPEWYIPQIQLSLEVFDLEVCHFVQYKPDMGKFDPPKLEVTIVNRDREWFDTNLPLFQKFISDLNKFKEYIRSLSEGDDKETTKAATGTRKRKYPEECIIKSSSELALGDASVMTLQ